MELSENISKYHSFVEAPISLDLQAVTRLLVMLGYLCFLLSLFQTTLFTSGEDIQGYWVLLIGWIGLVFFQFAWFANPLNLLAVLLMKSKPRLALVLSIIAVLLATMSFDFSEIPVGFNHNKVFIKELGFGTYLWFISQCFLLMSQITNVAIKRA